jgi:acetyl-CoA acetyltransferase
MSAWSSSGAVAIAGVGYSQIGRRLPRPLGLLARDAVRDALEDAGLSARDVDGVSTYPDMPVRGSTSGSVDGIDIVSATYMIRALGIEDHVRWYSQNNAGLLVGSIVNAVHAIASGACQTAVVWRAMHMPPSGRYSGWTAPSADNDLHATREAMGKYLVQNRRNAALNPRAVFRDVRLELGDYVNARMIAEPMSILDCDMPLDGVAALVLTRADIAAALRQPPVYIRGIGQVPTQHTSWWADAARLDRQWQAGEWLAAQLVTSSGLSITGIDSLQIYDGFSPFVFLWLEGLGICKHGEAWRMAEAGLLNGGGLRINSSGGSLGEGRLHGFSHIAEAVYQVSGRAGPRQLPGAHTALVTVGQPAMNSGGFIFSASRSG